MRIGIYLLAVVSISLFFTSCSKEKSVEVGLNPPAIIRGNGVFKMKINGIQWEAGVTAYASISSGFIHINGKSKDNKAFIITLGDTLATTYVLSQGSMNLAALSDIADLSGIAYGTNEGADTADAGGVVVVTNIDKVNKTISGTFRCKIFRDIDGSQKQITEGVFDKVSYNTSTSPGSTANTTDTMRAKIDNAAWSAVGITSTAVGGSIFISGAAIDGVKSVSLSVPQNVTSGTYDLNIFSPVGLYFPTPSTIYASESGNITVTEHNTVTKRIRGSFNFKATDQTGSKSALLTDGYFSVKYQ